jgi:hypothetical protein
MASVALTTDQKEQLKQSGKFSSMIRSAAFTKANFWAVTTVPTAVPGGQTDPNLIRWAKSRQFSVQVLQNPTMFESNINFVAFFLNALTQSVWDQVAHPAPFTSAVADAIIVDMETNAATLIDPAMDSAFDTIIKYSNF